MAPLDGEETETKAVTVHAFGTTVEREFDVPVGVTPVRRMLPIFRSLADTVIDGAVAQAEAEGRTVSCKPGCAACCRQLIPIPPAEAYAIRAMVDGLPEPRRSAVRARFDDAARRIDAWEHGPSLAAPVWDDDHEHFRMLALAYYALGIPCPFLDDAETCSIYSERPLVCREFLVTSPAENCERPGEATIESLPANGHVSRRVSSMDLPPEYRGGGPWTPLTLAFRWAAAHPEREPGRTGAELLEEVLGDERPPAPPR